MAAPTFVQGIADHATGGVNPGASFGLSLPAPPANGNLLVAGMCVSIGTSNFPIAAMPGGFVDLAGLEDTTSGLLTSIFGYRQSRGGADQSIIWTCPLGTPKWDTAMGWIAEYAGLQNALVEASGHKKVAVDPGFVAGILVNAGTGPRVIIAQGFARAGGTPADITPHGPWAFRLTDNTSAPGCRLWMGDALVDAAATSYQPGYQNTGAASEFQDKTIDFASGSKTAIPDAFGGSF